MSVLASAAIIVSLLLAITNQPPDEPQPERLYGIVVGVTDGDTVKILTPRFTQTTIRLHGIDAPEKRQPFGSAAKQHLASMCFNKIAIVEVTGTDRYGRTIGVLNVSGTNLNQEMVRSGFAWWYRQYARRDATLEQLELEARNAGFGLWQDPNPIAPWEWRRQRRR